MRYDLNSSWNLVPVKDCLQVVNTNVWKLRLEFCPASLYKTKYCAPVENHLHTKNLFLIPLTHNHLFHNHRPSRHVKVEKQLH